jgi:hypothetical protein
VPDVCSDLHILNYCSIVSHHASSIALKQLRAVKIKRALSINTWSKA